MYFVFNGSVSKTTRTYVYKCLFAPNHVCDPNVYVKINTYWMKWTMIKNELNYFVYNINYFK